MRWLKSVIVDILVTIFIGISYWFRFSWMWWVIAVYSALILFAKVIALYGETFLRQSKRSEQAPEWFYHVLYFLNIILLIVSYWWYLAGAWVLIWLFSYLAQRKTKTG
ncbi:MAG TPA: hypothetical protein VE868_10240 [Balneolaceae bacterium]|nr:hypothetical protein [Balneolaceae bacterium]